jgi:AraC family transcriptional regulator
MSGRIVIEKLEPRRARRTTLLDLPVGLVEDLWHQDAFQARGPEDFSAEFQVCLPYSGLFVWHVGQDDVVGDANQVLFVAGGEGYRMSAPLAGGYRELIVTPSLNVLSEIAGTSEAHLARHPWFRRRGRRADSRLQNLRTRFLHWATDATEVDDFAAEELVLVLLRTALDGEAPRSEPAQSTRRLIRRTKEFVEAHASSPIRLRDAARAVGASPAYLTDVFSRVEGVPLHQYLTQLRLSRALVELPEADDLTALALDLGFSSHSHFAAAFRRAFGCTPSEFRKSTRKRPRPFIPSEGPGFPEEARAIRGQETPA